MQFVHLQKILVLPPRTLSKTLDWKTSPLHIDRSKRCQLDSTDDHLLHCASTIVYSIMGVTQRTAWIRRQQLRYVQTSDHFAYLVNQTLSAFFKQSQNVRLSCKSSNLNTSKNGALTLLITHHTEILPMEKGHVILKIIEGHAAFSIPELVSWLEFNVPFCHKYGWPYQRRKVRGGQLSLPSEGRLAIY